MKLRRCYIIYIDQYRDENWTSIGAIDKSFERSLKCFDRDDIVDMEKRREKLLEMRKQVNSALFSYKLLYNNFVHNTYCSTIYRLCILYLFLNTNISNI